MAKYQVEDTITGKKYIFEGESPPTEQDIEMSLEKQPNIPEIRQAQPISPLGQLKSIIGAKMSFAQKIRSAEETIMPPSPEESIAQAQNINAISQTTGISRPELTKNNLELYSQAVRNPKITGITPDLSRSQFSQMAFAPAIATGLTTNLPGTLLGMGIYGGLNKLFSPEKFISRQLGETAQAGLETADILGKGALTSALYSPTTKVFQYVASKYGKPALAAIMDFGAKIPEYYGKKAMENPEVLSPKWLEQEGKIASQGYQTTIQALRDNADATIKPNLLQALGDLLNKEQLGKTKTGKMSPNVAKVSPSKIGMLQNWISEIQNRVKGKIKTDFTDLETLRNKMDGALKEHYVQLDVARAGGKKAKGDAFTLYTSKLRDFISETMKLQFPEAAPIIDRYHNWLEAKKTYEFFRSRRPAFFRAIPLKILLQMSGVTGVASSGIAGLGTMPAFYKQAILKGGRVGKQFKGFPGEIGKLFNE